MTIWTGLGSRGPVGAQPDLTGNNPGNWTIAFTPDILAFIVPEAYVYKLTVNGPVGSYFSLYIDQKQWASNIYGQQNDWEDAGSEALFLLAGQTMYLYYSTSVASSKPPVATIWLRYDSEKWVGYL